MPGPGRKPWRPWHRRLFSSRFRWLSVRRLREVLREEVTRIIRLSAAVIIAYLLVRLVEPGSTDLTGPLTALLVVRTTAYRTLHTGLDRIAAVLFGVALAVGVSSWFGLTWWSLGAVIALGLLVAHLLRLGDNLLEVPISAMLILGAAQADTAAGIRLLNTLIGAAVGVLFTVMIPARLPIGDAGTAVRAVADATADALRRVGVELSQQLTRAQVSSWLADIHATLPLVSKAEEAVQEADESRMFNPRVLQSTLAANPAPILRTGLASLDQALLAIRQLLMAIRMEAPDTADDDPRQVELRHAFAVVILDISDAVRAFGALVEAEAGLRETAAIDATAETLEVLRETRAMVTELLMVDVGDDTQTWLLRGSILGAVEGVLTALDVERRAKTRARVRHEEALRSELPVMTRLGLSKDTWRRVDEQGP
ncbi:MAG: hypothetical protein IPI32_12645 [Austwickia sp.]|jgi:hypothetical protein|nr:hypothetical protein [Austwickia sp.]MBK8435083.1 hypothetical protein [Austwickia sp.]MBK9101363.1 hypothetical protein [Austwickia sp.]